MKNLPIKKEDETELSKEQLNKLLVWLQRQFETAKTFDEQDSYGNLQDAIFQKGLPITDHNILTMCDYDIMFLVYCFMKEEV